MFEHSPANPNLFDIKPIVSFHEVLVAPNCHVIYNNSFVTLPGGGISHWHQDDPPHMIVTHGKYARRLVGHKYSPFMNYTMPEEVYKNANPRLKRLLGFLEHGACG